MDHGNIGVYAMHIWCDSMRMHLAELLFLHIRCLEIYANNNSSRKTPRNRKYIDLKCQASKDQRTNKGKKAIRTPDPNIYIRKIFATKMRLKLNQISVIYICRILWTCVNIFIDCALNCARMQCTGHPNGIGRLMLVAAFSLFHVLC